MGMVVRTNTMALNAYRQLGMNNNAVAKSLEKLSSGFRINRAADDAAGLAISEKMKAQIKGLETASANAQDGISLLQTAEGNLSEVHNMLNRMVELATKSANGTYTSTEREALQDEVDQLLEEIDRISQSANFNGARLLDGSLAKGGGGKIYAGMDRIIKDVLGSGEDAVANTGVKTILDGANGTTAVKTKFDVDFTGLKTATAAGGAGGGTPSKVEGTAKSDISVKTGAGASAGTAASGTLSITWGTAPTWATDDTVTLEASGGDITFSATATKTATGWTVTGAPTGFNATFDGTDLVLTATAVGKKTNVGLGTLTATIGTYDAGGTKPIGTLAGTITDGTDVNLGTGAVTADATGLNTTNIKAAADAANLTADAAITFKKGAGDKLELYAGTTKIGISDETVDGATTDFTFKTIDGATNLGTIKLSSATAAANVPTTDMDTELDYTAAVAGAGGGAGGTDKTNFDFKLGGTTLATGVDVEAGKSASDIATAVFDKLTDADGDDTNGIQVKLSNGATYTVTDGNGKLSFELVDDPTAKNVSGNFDWDIVENAASKVAIDGNHTAGTVVTLKGAVAGANDIANTVFRIEAGDIKDGTTIRINDKTVTLQVGQNSTASGAINVDLKDFEEGEITDANLNEILGRISADFAGSTTNFIVGVNNTANGDAHKGLTVHKKDAVTDKYTTLEKLAGVFELKTPGSGSPLTLQIGDTAEDFNKMSVSIDDMSAQGLKIDGLDITTEANASNAIDKIKAAINTVSSARAGMGALQNRLEYTINNLDVAVENLSAANSRIRDTDMAKEMMNYTKMNVLVQSAQAMLAQANQQPQSVLQLLQ